MAAAAPAALFGSTGGLLGGLGTVLSLGSTLSGMFGGGKPEAPSLPPPPPAPEVQAPRPQQVAEESEQAIADEQARNREIRRRRQETQRSTLTSLNRQGSSLLGE